MDVSPEQMAELEEALRQLEQLDPSDLPGPAASLAEILGRILDPPENP
jgi:hypothetical protein